MKTIEITTRLRVPDDTTSDQLAAFNAAVAHGATRAAATVLAGDDAVQPHIELVLPLQDVIIYGDTL